MGHGPLFNASNKAVECGPLLAMEDIKKIKINKRKGKITLYKDTYTRCHDCALPWIYAINIFDVVIIRSILNK